MDDLLTVMPAPIDATRDAIEALNRETERWVRKAIEKGPGWNVWRSNAETKYGDPFVIVHKFALLPPGLIAAPAGVVLIQPDLTPGERARLLAGRHDWKEDGWEDECGVPGCDHDCCAVYWGRKDPVRL